MQNGNLKNYRRTVETWLEIEIKVLTENKKEYNEKEELQRFVKV